VTVLSVETSNALLEFLAIYVLSQNLFSRLLIIIHEVDIEIFNTAQCMLCSLLGY
jgi:hypothetical protein